MKPLQHPLTSRTEMIDIAKAWFAVSLAFALVYGGAYLLGGSLSRIFSPWFLWIFLVALFTAGIGFLLHELAHKLVALHYGCLAEFRAFPQMLYLALGLAAVTGFIFAAPGAVMISGVVTRKENGLISLAGPAMNYLLAFLFLFLIPFFPVVEQILAIGFSVNAWLGLFNLLPFGNFDGRKIFDWNKVVWGGMVALGIFFLFF